MAWSRVLGHDEAVTRLRESIARGRLAHAYLFVGRRGVGKELLSRELAKALQCRQPGADPCDECPQCRKVEHDNHPDVTFVRLLEGARGGARRSQIVIDQVRQEIQQPISYKPFEGQWKVFVVADAERMTEQAQNCLLKTLEEPPPRSVLVLLAERLEPFLPTVVSRCQVVRFRPLAPALVERILVEDQGLEPARARVLARLSEGSPGLALAYENDGTYEAAVWLIGELAGMPPGAEFVVANELLDRSSAAGSRLEDTRPVLDLLTLAWRDVFLRSAGFPEELLTWPEVEPLTAWASALGPGEARRLLERTLLAREHLDANANIKLLVEKLVLDIGAVLHRRATPAAR